MTELETQQFVRPAQRIVIRGVGFCPGTTVKFGNKHAVVKPVSISPDGTRMVIDVPRLATDGQITLIRPYGDPLTNKQGFMVKSYRNQRGFAFQNRGGRAISWDEFVQVFGEKQTHLVVDACPWLPGVRCDVVTPWPSPLAVGFYLAVANSATKGLCFGMSVASLRLKHGAQPLSSFDPNAKTVWQLPSATGPSQGLSDYIHKLHLIQHSVEMVIFRKKAKYARAADFHDDLVDQLRRGEAAIVGFRPGDGETGHAIVGYDVQELGGGAFDVIAYNANDPYDTGEVGDNDSAADAHKADEASGTLHVNADGTWSFSEFAWSGSLDNLYLIPYAAIPSSRHSRRT